MAADPAHFYITPHCTEPDLAMPFIEAIAPATLPLAISWRRARLPQRMPQYKTERVLLIQYQTLASFVSEISNGEHVLLALIFLYTARNVIQKKVINKRS